MMQPKTRFQREQLLQASKNHVSGFHAPSKPVEQWCIHAAQFDKIGCKQTGFEEYGIELLEDDSLAVNYISSGSTHYFALIKRNGEVSYCTSQDERYLIFGGVSLVPSTEPFILRNIRPFPPIEPRVSPRYNILHWLKRFVNKSQHKDQKASLEQLQLHELLAIALDGNIIWQENVTGVLAEPEPLIYYKDRIYCLHSTVDGGEEYFGCLDTNGKQYWVTKLPQSEYLDSMTSYSRATVMLSSLGRFYISGNNRLVMMDLNGNILNHRWIEFEIRNSLVGSDNNVYLHAILPAPPDSVHDTEYYIVLDPDLQELYRIPLPYNESSAMIGVDTAGQLYIWHGRQILLGEIIEGYYPEEKYVFRRTIVKSEHEKEQWSCTTETEYVYPFEAQVDCTGALIYLDNGKLTCVDASGELLWKYAAEHEFSNFLLGDDGFIYGVAEEYVYGIGEKQLH